MRQGLLWGLTKKPFTTTGMICLRGNTVHHDEALNQKAAEWVHEHTFVKGEPNMMA